MPHLDNDMPFILDPHNCAFPWRKEDSSFIHEESFLAFGESFGESFYQPPGRDREMPA